MAAAAITVPTLLNLTQASFLDFGTGAAGNLTFGTYQNSAERVAHAEQLHVRQLIHVQQHELQPGRHQQLLPIWNGLCRLRPEQPRQHLQPHRHPRNLDLRRGARPARPRCVALAPPQACEGFLIFQSPLTSNTRPAKGLVFCLARLHLMPPPGRDGWPLRATRQYVGFVD